jgi:hypothetical protein
MSDHPDDRPVEDPGANTEMWQAFAAGPPEAERPKAVGAPFRLITLGIGLVVFALIVWFLLAG